MAAGRMSSRSSTRRPVHAPRCVSQAATTASTDDTAAAERPNTRVFWSAVPFGPLKMYSKFANVGVVFPGNATVSAETRSDPYTSVIIPARARHAAKHAHETAGGTGGRGIDEARPDTVTNERGPSSRTFAK